MKTKIEHWRYEDGWEKDFPLFPVTYKYTGEYQGWFCWCYPSDDFDIEEWMQNNMKHEYEVTWRFNSGNPMYTIRINDKNDAINFAYKFNLKV